MQRAPAQALGVAQRGDVDVDGLPGLGEGRQAAPSTSTAATFFSWASPRRPARLMPNCCSMAFRLCVVKGVCVVWSPVPSRPTTMP
jgi:hypothetical protein